MFSQRNNPYCESLSNCDSKIENIIEMASKRILGLDIGVSSVGLAIVIEDENGRKDIEKLAVRVIPEDPNFHGKFYSGNTASKNLERRIKRGIRRNNQRFKLRRDRLYGILKKHEMFPNKALFELNAEKLYELRARAISEKLELQELGRVLIHLNQRRGFLSNRKADNEENATEYKKAIENLETERANLTIGQKLYKELKESENLHEIVLRERTYLRSSYIEEFDRIWEAQKEYYPDLLTGGSQEELVRGTLYDEIKNKTIYYQRPLKSAKGLVSECEFEKFHRSIPKSSPVFELFRIWQRLNDLNWRLDDGTLVKPNLEQKKELADLMIKGKKLNSKGLLSISEIKKFFGFSRNQRVYFNFKEIEGSKTAKIIREALKKAKVKNIDALLSFDYHQHDEKGGLYELWHISYSLPDKESIISTLQKRFGFTEDEATVIASEVNFKSDFGKLSSRAIKKILPYMEEGLQYSEACDKVGYDHSGYKNTEAIADKLTQVKPNSLKNPVVEQVLNQVVNMVNLAIDEYGKFDEIRVELARELRNSARARNRISSNINRNKKENQKIRERLKDEYGFNIVNGRDVKRYKLWQETDKQCLYCSNPITNTDFLNGNAEIEHILPKSRSFNNAMNNYILSHKKCNSDKGQRTAYDFMKNKSEADFEAYVDKVNELYNAKKQKISQTKFDNLLCSGDDIPSDFIERMKKDSQYIAKETVKMLKTICPRTLTTTGQVTDLLRAEWGLKHVLEELGLPKYRAIGQVETKTIKDKEGNIKQIEKIIDWSKRDDHRHHAVDALICALTDQKVIFKLNNLNKIFQYERDALSPEEIQELERINQTNFDLKHFVEQAAYEFKEPIDSLRSKTKNHLESIFISFKKPTSKVLTKNLNNIKNGPDQITWVPRNRLHEDTIMGERKRRSNKKIKLNMKFDRVEDVVSELEKEVIERHLKKYDNDTNIAFSSKTLKKDPILIEGEKLESVSVYEVTNSKRVPLSESFTSAQTEKIIDDRIKELVKKRINDFRSIKSAFKDIEAEPLWFNKEKGIKVKSVSVYDESKVIDVRSGTAKTGGNHHALIYKDENGKYHDKVVSFNDAVQIGLLNIEQKGKPYPIIQRHNDPDLGEFQFSMQNNDLFVFDLKHSRNPTDENEIDFFDVRNRKLISDKLYRVQKMTKKSTGTFEVTYRHHLETSIDRGGVNLKTLTWDEHGSNTHLMRLVKLKVNHLGKIIKVGE